MSRKVPTNLDVRLGSALLPAGIRRVTTDHRGGLTAHVDAEAHDLDLLAAVGSAIRSEGHEIVDLLVRYSELRDQADLAELDGERALRRSLLDQAADAVADLEVAMQDTTIGETLVAVLRPSEAKALADALAPEAVAA